MKNNKAFENYLKTKQEIGYVPLEKADENTYKRIGFKSGLEVHQQLKTEKKLFCNCPAGIYHSDDDYDAEIIRHMRPTLSEMGEYDGTALMEFKTRKTIIYRINNRTTCTYEIDDTPPFPMNRQALDIAVEISLLSKLNIVGEVHITRKQYLDGSIPTGFQRTAIVGVEGEIPLKHKKVRLLQLSIEEDACREISDVGHTRIYKTDRLGMPLIETVTYPDMFTPQELAEAAQVIRFINRSSGKVRTGIGAAREDVNVSCKGGTRVEIKGVAHIKLIPQLSHNEAFRQCALLNIKNKLNARTKKENWNIIYKKINYEDYNFSYQPMKQAYEKNYEFYAVKLPYFANILSHFTQPGKTFTDEIAGRLKVIACLLPPFMITSEDINPKYDEKTSEHLTKIAKSLNATENDAIIIFWAPKDDVKTALETIQERALMAFDGVPPETRKWLPDGTTTFERVLPGPDRMYPDTDLPPIPLEDQYIERIKRNIKYTYDQILEKIKKWQINENIKTYILRNNLVPIIDEIIAMGFEPKFVAYFFGQNVKYWQYKKLNNRKKINYRKIVDMFAFIKQNNLHHEIAKRMLPIIIEHPNMELQSVLNILNFKKRKKEELIAPIDFLIEKFYQLNPKHNKEDLINWIMGELRNLAIGNISLKELRNEIQKRIPTKA